MNPIRPKEIATVRRLRVEFGPADDDDFVVLPYFDPDIMVFTVSCVQVFELIKVEVALVEALKPENPVMRDIGGSGAKLKLSVDQSDCV